MIYRPACYHVFLQYLTYRPSSRSINSINSLDCMFFLGCLLSSLTRIQCIYFLGYTGKVSVMCRQHKYYLKLNIQNYTQDTYSSPLLGPVVEQNLQMNLSLIIQWRYFKCIIGWTRILEWRTNKWSTNNIFQVHLITTRTSDNLIYTWTCGYRSTTVSL
jgi:hypothetical protein